MSYQESITEAAERYLKRQPVTTLISGRPLYEHQQMIRAFCAGNVAVIEEDIPSPLTLPLGSQAAADVLAERLRQVSVEDFRTDEDDHYTSGEMAWAATCYLQNAAVAGKMQGLGLLTAAECDERGKSLPKPDAWPWDAEWWKPSGQRRDLVKAAALIIAEIERLDRAVTEGFRP